MGRPRKKKTSEFDPSLQEINAMAYCVHNGIVIYPVLSNFGKFTLNVEIDRNGLSKTIKSPREYEQHELLEPIYKIYLKYFFEIADADMIKKSMNDYIKF